MVSNLKMYKNQISRIKSGLERALKSRVNINPNVGRGYIARALDVPIPGYSRELSTAGYVYLIEPNVIVEEYGDMVVLGIDTSKLRVRFEDNSSLISSVFSYVYHRSKSDYKAEELANDFESDGIALNYNNYDSKIRNSKSYREIVNQIVSIEGDCKIFLADKQYPRVLNRNILPLITLNMSSGDGWYIYTRYSVDSYRKDHKVFYWSMGSRIDYEEVVKCIPVYFLRMEYKDYSRSLYR